LRLHKKTIKSKWVFETKYKEDWNQRRDLWPEDTHNCKELIIKTLNEVQFQSRSDGHWDRLNEEIYMELLIVSTFPRFAGLMEFSRRIIVCMAAGITGNISKLFPSNNIFDVGVVMWMKCIGEDFPHQHSKHPQI
ncbi:hypothetical protein T4A_12210, partial [Trichinella pseudospiralis]